MPTPELETGSNGRVDVEQIFFRRNSDGSLELPHASFGAVVDIDVKCLLERSGDSKKWLNDAFNEHGLLLFRNQTLTPQQELDFMRLLPFNEMDPGPTHGVPGKVRLLERKRLFDARVR